MEKYICGLKNGEPQAFELLETEFKQKIFAVCSGILGNREDALDVTQEVFLKIYKGVPNFNEDSSISTWIYRITKNACYDFLRKNNLDLESDIPENIVDKKQPLPEEVIERNENIYTIRELLKKVPVKYKTPLILREYENLSYAQIASVLEISEGTVKSRIHRAKEYLSKLISENMELF